MKKQIITLFTLLAGLAPAGSCAQIAAGTTATPTDTVDYSFDAFRTEVMNYSKTLAQSVEQQVAMKKSMQAAKASYFPAIDASGNYQYRVNDKDLSFGGSAVPTEHDLYNVGISVMQPVYAGGSIKHTYRSQTVQSAIADQAVQLTKDNVLYAIENSYWGTSAQREMYKVMCTYNDIVDELLTVLEDRYTDGMISKTDLIQMQVRKKEAQLQKLNTLEQYKLAKQNMNVMMGKAPNAPIRITDEISTRRTIPDPIDLNSALDVRPDLRMAQLDVDYQKSQIKLAASKYNPKVYIGYQGVWGTEMINVSGVTRFNNTFLVSLQLPIFHWGARSRSVAAQRALLSKSRFALQDKQDQISRELAAAWTNVVKARQRIALAQQNCKLADENLDLNTFSYTEGKLSILDVLSAQLTWIQAYTNLVNSQYLQKIAQADYYKASGARYL